MTLHSLHSLHSPDLSPWSISRKLLLQRSDGTVTEWRNLPKSYKNRTKRIHKTYLKRQQYIIADECCPLSLSQLSVIVSYMSMSTTAGYCHIVEQFHFDTSAFWTWNIAFLISVYICCFLPSSLYLYFSAIEVRSNPIKIENTPTNNIMQNVVIEISIPVLTKYPKRITVNTY